MSKQVFTGDQMRVQEFAMYVHGRAFIQAGTDLGKFLEEQEYLIKPHDASGCIFELSIDSVKEVSPQQQQTQQANPSRSTVWSGVPGVAVRQHHKHPAMSEAQKKRWKEYHEKKQKRLQGGSHSMTVEGRARVSEAQKRRWEIYHEMKRSGENALATA